VKDVNVRLIAEVRQLTYVLDYVRHELREYMYGDLDKLSLSGAVAYLIRHKLLLDEVKQLVERSNCRPQDSAAVLLKIARLLEKAE